MKMLHPSSTGRERGAALRGLILDIEGTLCAHGRPLPGAIAALEALRGAGLDLRFVTNTSAIPPSAVGQRLRAMGFAILDRHVFTPARAALHYLSGRTDRKCMYLVSDAVRPVFTSLEAESDEANIILMGDMGHAFTFHDLNRAFRRMQSGAELVLLQDNPWWRAPDGPTLDCGAFAAALRHATGQTPTVLGKPNPCCLSWRCTRWPSRARRSPSSEIARERTSRAPMPLEFAACSWVLASCQETKPNLLNPNHSSS